MSDLRALYQEIILDHYKRPRNFRALEEATRKAEGYNPLCGDRVTVYVRLDDDGRVEDVAFEGAGCAISTASASLMTEAIKGKTRAEAEDLLGRFHRLVATTEEREEGEDLGKLEALSGVRDYPVRIKCAILPWHALKAALGEDGPQTVTTE